jgi:D-3-phosphoglycerate dehydrogenase
MNKILVSTSSFGECGAEPMNLLNEQGFELVFNPYGRKLSEEELIELGKDSIGVVAGLESYSKNVFDKLTELKCISRVGVGIDSIDMKLAEHRGIKIFITPDGPAQAVAELSLALAMDLLRRVSLSDRRIRAGVWRKEIGYLLYGKTVGIMGLGRIGKKVSSIYRALGCNVIACDKLPDDSWAILNEIKISSQDYLFRNSDIISIHIPGSENGKAVIASQELKLLKENAILLNLSRGGVIDEIALLKYLQKTPSAYAALDVFQDEPYKGPLTALDNIVFTPHIGTSTRETKLAMEIEAVNNLVNFFKS